MHVQKTRAHANTAHQPVHTNVLKHPRIICMYTYRPIYTQARTKHKHTCTQSHIHSHAFTHIHTYILYTYTHTQKHIYTHFKHTVI